MHLCAGARKASHNQQKIAADGYDYRKVALMYIEQGELKKAEETLAKCESPHREEAIHQILLFIIFVRRRDEQKAMSAAQSLFAATDFDSSMLPLVCIKRIEA